MEDRFDTWSRQLRASDRDAYTDLFDTMHAPLLRYATRLTNEETAYDVVQNAFVSLWQMRASIDPDRSLKSLLYTLVRNEALNRRRATDRRRDRHREYSPPRNSLPPDNVEAGDTTTAQLSLQAERVKLDEAVVTAEACSTGPDEAATLGSTEAVTMPGAQGNFFCARQSLAGVAAPGPGAGLRVRGGDVTETKASLDGATVNHPYRCGSPAGRSFSAVRPFLVGGTCSRRAASRRSTVPPSSRVSSLAPRVADSLALRAETLIREGNNAGSVDSLRRARTLAKRVTGGSEHQAPAHYYAALADFRMINLFPDNAEAKRKRIIQDGISHPKRAVDLDAQMAGGWVASTLLPELNRQSS